MQTMELLLRIQSVNLNNLGTYPHISLSSTLMNDVMPFQPNETSSEYLHRLYATRRPTIIIGDLFPEVDVSIANIFASPSTAYVDPPLTQATRYARNTWTLKPSLAELVHAIALLLQKVYSPGKKRGGRVPKVFLAADNAVGFDVALKSLHTVQFPIFSGGVSNLSDPGTLRGQLHSAVGAAARGDDVVLVVSSLTPSVITDLVNAAADVTAQLAAANPDVLAVVSSRFVLCIATDQNYLKDAKFQMADPSALSHFPIYFASYMYPFWELDNRYRLKAAMLLNTTSYDVLETISAHSAMLIFTMFVDAIARSPTPRPTVTDLFNQIYDDAFLTANGIVLGPIDDDNCTAEEIAANSADRQCQCFKILRTINVYDFRGWLANDAAYDPNFLWSMDTCGVQYEPLLVATTLNVGAIAGAAVPCGVAALGVLLYFALCYGRRSNGAAPKDAGSPFAMVFTDIQSSTSLWARAPEQMGAALEQHHSLLRALVRRHDGYEVKTIGDSFMVAFKRAGDAAAFGLAIQHALFAASWDAEIDDVYIALAQEAHEEMLLADDPKKVASLHHWEDDANYRRHWNGIRVRVGMHWGVGSVKFDAVSQGYDYYGTLVNTAARVEGVGNGGQVLATRDLYLRLEDEGLDLAGVAALGPQPLAAWPRRPGAAVPAVPGWPARASVRGAAPGRRERLRVDGEPHVLVEHGHIFVLPFPCYFQM